MYEEDWVVCICCGRCYQVSKARDYYGLSGVHLMCAYPDCEGNLYADTWSYDTVRSEVRPDWPETPEQGKRYIHFKATNRAVVGLSPVLA